MSQRILMCGGRDYYSRKVVEAAFDDHVGDDAVIVHGDARGADTLADSVARERGIAVEPHPARWKECDGDCTRDHMALQGYCPAAGHRRNREMLESGIDLVIAFPGGGGTRNMISQSQKAGIKVIRYGW